MPRPTTTLTRAPTPCNTALAMRHVWAMNRLLTRPASVQDHYSEVRERLAAAVKELKSGDPRREDTFIGPLISEKEAQRVQDWVAEAVARGREPCPAPVKHLGVSGHATH